MSLPARSRSPFSDPAGRLAACALAAGLALAGCGGDPDGAPGRPAGPGAPSGGVSGTGPGKPPLGAGPPGGGVPGEAPGAACVPGTPFPTPLRRLTRVEYDNTVRDLLGDATAPARRFPPDELSGGFANNAAVLTVSPLLAERYQEAAEALAAAAVRDLGKLVPCDPTKGGAAGEEACARSFVESFGRRAYRRPLAAAEVTRHLALFSAARAGATFARGIEVLVGAMLQSPGFLYRLELGLPGAAGEGDRAGLVRLGPYEIASRLSYLLWASMPDDRLFAAAAAGKLGTPAEVAEMARSMLDDPRARRAVSEFYRQWLGAAAIEGVAKDPAIYPDWGEPLRAAMAAELPAFVEHVLWGADGRLATLLAAPVTVATAPVARIYGVEAAGGRPVALDGTRRAGVLTQPGILAVHALPNQSSPVQRGKFVREQLLCQEAPPAPPDLDVTPPEVDPRKPTRERFAQHTKDEACASCHRLMDPLGFGFEHFDGVGRYRATDGGRPVDASGTIVNAGAIDGPFRGAPELAKKLAASPVVGACVATQWYRFAFGRLETPGDACALRGLHAAFEAARYDLRELLLALTAAETFLYRRPIAGEVPR
jgi:hypothetical protein